MKLPEAPWQSREGMAQLLRALDADTGATRFVGGCVRDTLLGLEVSDVDLATRLPPEEMLQRLRKAGIKAVPTGIAHGTITAVLRDSVVEVTTLRRDVSTDGRRATVAFTDDFEEDAARRDFTINALSAAPGGEVQDYFGGLDDLAVRRVRFIGDPLVRIAEDHLRILRFFRFHARFGRGKPDAAGLAACSARANDLMALSRERIADELLKLLGLPNPSATASLMQAQGIFAPVLPEISAAGTERLGQLVRREREAGVPPAAIRRLAALLPADEAVAASVAARLRLSKKDAKRLAAAAAREADCPSDVGLLAYRLGVDAALDWLLLADAPPADLAGAAALLSQWERPHFPVGGGDLIAMGLKPGPGVARALQAIEREWAEGGFRQSAGELRALARDYVARALRERQ